VTTVSPFPNWLGIPEEAGNLSVKARRFADVFARLDYLMRTNAELE